MKHVILVAMIDSVHTVRWIQNWQRTDEVEFTLVPSGPHRKPHPELVSLMSPNGPIREIRGSGIFGGLISYALDKFLGTPLQLKSLKAAIAQTKNSKYYLHYLETQHSGYLALRFLKKQDLPIVVGSNWGSDLYWFKRYERHRKKIVELLKRTDKYLVECQRDYDLAEQLGYKGEKTIIGPNSFAYRTRLEVNKEDLIVVKGYQGWAGLSHLVLRVLARNRREVRNFEIVIYSASSRTNLYCKYLRKRYGINITAYPKHHFSQQEMVHLFSRSRVYIGASKTDGISTSALEAMNQGAIPIQTNTSCINTLLSEGINGFAPEPTEEAIGQALLSALSLLSNNEFETKKSVELLENYGSDRVARARYKFAYDL